MPINDLLSVIQWWAILFISGLLFFPLVKNIFPFFLDKGYAFSKIFALITVSYISFILGLLKIVPFTSVSIYIIFAVCGVSILVSSKKSLKSLFNLRVVALFLTEEVIFFTCLLAWSYVRGFNPEIYGLEKYMDFGFVNSILRSTYFPPTDMWFPPNPINYYYFGHFITAVLTKASGIPSFVSYNLMIATLFALTFIESLSIGFTLIGKKSEKLRSIFRAFFGGLLIACLVTLSGNLHVLYTFFKPYNVDQPVALWDLEFSLINPCFQKESYESKNSSGKYEIVHCNDQDRQSPFLYPNSYWYPNATRFIHNTIHEFPIYSWVVADLHGHVADIPIVLLVISVLYSCMLHYKLEGEKSDRKIRIRLILLTGFLISVMYMTNAWDGLTYLLLTMLMLLYLQWNRVYRNKPLNNTHNPILQILPNNKTKEAVHRLLLKHLPLDLLMGLSAHLFILLISFFIFSTPFSLNFDSSKIVGGIGVVGAPSILLEKNIVNVENMKYGYDNRNLLLRFFIPDHCKNLMTTEDIKLVTTQYNTRKIGPFIFEPDHCLRSPWWQLLILYGFFYFFVLVFIVFSKNKKTLNTSDKFIALLILTSTILIIIPEFFYMKDIYPDHYRANTMFKLVFQAFIMLSISTGYIFTKTVSGKYFKSLSLKLIPLYIMYSILAVTLVTLVFTYPYFAISSYYNRLITYVGLDGVKYLKNKTPGDYEAIKWLNENVTNQPVVLEAQGDSYTDYERISANTGLPTVLGWYVHEWLWRGQDTPKPRADDVKQLYESMDLIVTRNLLIRYNVSYVIIGKLEKEKYPTLDEQKFEMLGEKVFESGDTKIFKISI